MVNDIRFGRHKSRKAFFFVNEGEPTIYVCRNLKLWAFEEMLADKQFHKVVAALLSHESIHVALEKFDFIYSDTLDNVFGGSRYWNKDMHGLGDFAREFKKGVKATKETAKVVKILEELEAVPPVAISSLSLSLVSRRRRKK